MIAVTLLTCDRAEYTRRTVESLLRSVNGTPMLRLHGDDASTDRAVGHIARDAGFETVVQHTRRQGAQVTRKALVDAAAARGAEWVIMLENDWAWVRPFPADLFNYVRQRGDVYCLRLYGQFKETNQTRPCFACHMGKPGRIVKWTPVPDAPEPAEIADVHYGSPPAVTRMAEARWLHEGPRSDREAGQKSGGLQALTMRVVNNVVYHIGAARTPQFRR